MFGSIKTSKTFKKVKLFCQLLLFMVFGTIRILYVKLSILNVLKVEMCFKPSSVSNFFEPNYSTLPVITVGK